FKAVTGMKQPRVVGHVEHRHERQSPGIFLWIMTPQDWNPLVDADRDLGVAAGPEHRAGACVRVNEEKVLSWDLDTPALWRNVPRMLGQGSEFRLADGKMPSCDSYKRKPNFPVADFLPEFRIRNEIKK